MRCKTCDYPLWNLRARQCPECGSAFRPSDFEFVPNSVQFRCPHCGQAYYGTADTGHLDPVAFACVSCNVPIHMDETVVLPTQGVEEVQTQVARLPWLERAGRGFFRAWIATIGLALFRPFRLMRLLPEPSPTGQALWFALLTNSVVVAITVLPMFLFMSIGGAGFWPGLVMAGVGVVTLIVGGALWIVSTHLLLRLTGRTAKGPGRTAQAIAYASGANVLSAIPCLGAYFGWLWWVVSAVLTVKEAQGVHWVRATVATLAFPLAAVAATVVFFTWAISTATGTMAAATAALPMAHTQTVVDAVLDYAEQHGGAGPGHAAELVAGGELFAHQLVAAGFTATQQADVPVGPATLSQLGMGLLTDEQRAAVAQRAEALLPPGTIAHRVGDFVFTHHGVDLTHPDPGLWLVILSPNPGSAPRVQSFTSVTVGLADGTVEQIPVSLWPARLTEQNALRATHGFAPLPEPAAVTHGAPAVGTP